MAMAQNALAAGPKWTAPVTIDICWCCTSTPKCSGETGIPPDHAERRCHLEDGPGVARSTAERLICDAAVVAVVRTSLGPTMVGEPLRLGRKTRKISPGLRRALRIRDDGCQHPGCHRRRHLEAHHVVHWKDGGPTNLENLVSVCRFHHMRSTKVVSRSVSPPRPVGCFIDRMGQCCLRCGSWLPGPVPVAAQDEWDPELIHPGWRGERFSLAESVGVLCRAADDRTTTNYGDPEFDNVIRINDFSRHMS